VDLESPLEVFDAWAAVHTKSEGQLLRDRPIEERSKKHLGVQTAHPSMVVPTGTQPIRLLQRNCNTSKSHHSGEIDHEESEARNV